MRFFFDRTWGASILDVVSGVSPHVTRLVHHDEHFACDTDDEDWIIPVSGWDGRWTIISGDYERVSRKEKTRVLCGTPHTWFVMVAKFMNANFDEQDRWLKLLWPRIVDRARHVKEPTIYTVGKPQLRSPIQKLITIARL